MSDRKEPPGGLVSPHRTQRGPVADLNRSQARGGMGTFRRCVGSDEDILALREAAIERILTPGAAMADIVAWLKNRVRIMK